MARQERPVYVCGKCIRNAGVREFIADHSSSARCSFCKRRRTALFDSVVEFMLERIEEDYEDATGVLPYESAEGGYQAAPTYTSWELLTEQIPLDLAPQYLDSLLGAIEARIPDYAWCDRDPFALSNFELLSYSWEAFCRIVKRRTRYFFQSTKRNTKAFVRDELLAPVALLREIAGLAEERGLIKEFGKGLVLYRARHQGRGERLRTALDLGPPLAHQAVRANRMNPPGIPVFYASRDAETALAETRDGRGTYVLGRFITRKPLLLLDLVALPEAMDYFTLDSESHQFANFLEGFSKEIARPVDRDNRNHIEYVPTQIVAEYFRVVYRTRGRSVDGILWRNASRAGKQSCALFASQADLVLSPELEAKLSAEERDLRGDDRGWLELTGHRSRRI